MSLLVQWAGDLGDRCGSLQEAMEQARKEILDRTTSDPVENFKVIAKEQQEVANIYAKIHGPTLACLEKHVPDALLKDKEAYIRFLALKLKYDRTQHILQSLLVT